MTLIARFSVLNTPFVIADILTSVPNTCGIYTNLPATRMFTSADVEYSLMGSEDYPIGMVQKIVIIDDCLVIAVAGKIARANELLGELRELRRARGRDFSHFFHWLSELNQSLLDEVSLVGWINCGNEFRAFDAGSVHKNVTAPAFDNVAMSGSGVPYFKELLSTCTVTSFDEGDGDGARAHRFAVLSAVLGVVGSLLVAEFATLGPLLNMFGSWYEIAVFNGGRWQKISDLLFAVWLALPGEKDSQVQLQFQSCVKGHYKDNVLYIRSGAWGHGDEGLLGSVSTIPPYCLTATEIEKARSLKAPDIELHAELACHLLIAVKDGMTVGCASIFEDECGSDRFKVVVEIKDDVFETTTFAAEELMEKLASFGYRMLVAER